MKKILTIILLLHCEICFTQEVNLNGYNVFYYPEGGKSSEGYMVDGKPDGFWKTYYPNGKLKSAGNRSNMQLDSTWFFYNEQGDTTQIVNYRYGKKNGYSITFDNWKDTIWHSVRKSCELYVDNKRQGLAKYYYRTGALEQAITFKDDRKNGIGYQLDSIGRIVSVVTYKYNNLIESLPINRTDLNGLKQGIWRQYYPNFKVKSEEFYKDGKKNGYCRTYDDNGKEIQVERYIDGQLQHEDKNTIAKSEESVAIKNEYYSDGTIKSSGGFKDNKPVGVHRSYNEKGKINGGSTFDNQGNKIADGIVDGKGREQGRWMLYQTIDNKQTISAKGSYKNGKREGLWEFYFADGNIEQKGSYKSGKPEGQWLWYYNNGSLHRTENFVSGLEDGFFAEFSLSGDTLSCGEYLEGEKNGFWQTYIGDVLEKANYSDGLLQGEYLVYYMPENKLKIETAYLQGNLHGKYREYSQDGKILVEGSYVQGMKNGVWTTIDDDGLSQTKAEYSQGELVKIE